MIHSERLLYLSIAVLGIVSLSSCATSPDPLTEAFRQHWQQVANLNARIQDFNKRWEAAKEMEGAIIAGMSDKQLRAYAAWQDTGGDDNNPKVRLAAREFLRAMRETPDLFEAYCRFDEEFRPLLQEGVALQEEQNELKQRKEKLDKIADVTIARMESARKEQADFWNAWMLQQNLLREIRNQNSGVVIYPRY